MKDERRVTKDRIGEKNRIRLCLIKCDKERTKCERTNEKKNLTEVFVGKG